MAIAENSITYATNGNTISNGTYSTSGGNFVYQQPVQYTQTHVVDPLAGLVSQIEELREKVEHLLVMMDVLVRAELVKDLEPGPLAIQEPA